jgi:hypothetical protein
LLMLGSTVSRIRDACQHQHPGGDVYFSSVVQASDRPCEYCTTGADPRAEGMGYLSLVPGLMESTDGAGWGLQSKPTPSPPHS